MAHRKLLSAASIALMFLSAGAATPAMAQTRPTPSERETAQRQYGDLLDPGYTDVEDYPAYEVRAVVPAKMQAAQARAVYRQTRQDLFETVDVLRDDMERSPELVKAKLAEQTAYDAFVQERQRVLSALARNSEYAATMKLRNELAEELVELRSAKNVNTSQVLAVSQVKMQYSAKLTEMESIALYRDAPVQSARARMVEAAAITADVRARLDHEVRRDPQILAARNDMKTARINVVASSAQANASIEARDIALEYAYDLHRYDEYRYVTPSYYGYGYSGYSYRNNR